MNRIAMCCVLAVAACQGGSGSERSTVKVSEIERTRQTSGSTTIDRVTLRYDGARIVEVNNARNGTPNGHAKLTYNANGIERVEYFDKEGDRATDQLTYVDGQLARMRHEIPNVSTTEQSYVYFAEARDLLKETTMTHTPKSGFASSQLTRYEYDADARVARATTAMGTMTTATTEYRYNIEDRLDRATQFSGATVSATYTFRYLPDGKLDEVNDPTNNNRYELTYDQSGKVTEIRHTTTNGVITTTRYTYVQGSTDGWTFAPEIPAGELFDLAGTGFNTLEMLHGSVPSTDDIPKPF